MKFTLYIAKRYLFSKSSSNAINIITMIAAIGVVVGAMSLFIVLSGFSGLKDFSLQFTNVFDSDLKVFPKTGKTITFSEVHEAKLQDIEGIDDYSKVIEERVFLQYEGKNQIAYIKGIDSSYANVNPIDSILYFGNWLIPDQNEIVIGLGTAAKLSIGIRDYINLIEIYVPNPGTGQIDMLNPSSAFTMVKAVASGVYQVNEDLDSKYAFSDIEFARNLLKMDRTKVSAIEIKLDPTSSEEEIIFELNNIFSQGVIIKNRIQQNDALYKMLNTENIAVYLIFTLVLIIALFNVIGSIIMMVLDKRKNIKTLFSMGASIAEIRNIFFLQGVLLTTLGGAMGIFLGILIVMAQLEFELINITASLPYPVKLKLINVLVVFVTITVLGVLASKIASSRVNEKLID